MTGPLPTKTCPVCGRTFTWRKKWERSWAEVTYCSDACRRARNSPSDEALEAAILQLLEARAAGATICPSEAARAVAASASTGSGAADEAWRDLMEPARAAARRLVARGEVEITQGGQVVRDPSRTRGPIRIRRRRGGGA